MTETGFIQHRVSAAGFLIDEHMITAGPLLFILHKQKLFLETSNRYNLDVVLFVTVFWVWVPQSLDYSIGLWSFFHVLKTKEIRN